MGFAGSAGSNSGSPSARPRRLRSPRTIPCSITTSLVPPISSRCSTLSRRMMTSLRPSRSSGKASVTASLCTRPPRVVLLERFRAGLKARISQSAMAITTIRSISPSPIQSIAETALSPEFSLSRRDCMVQPPEATRERTRHTEKAASSFEDGVNGEVSIHCVKPPPRLQSPTARKWCNSFPAFT